MKTITFPMAIIFWPLIAFADTTEESFVWLMIATSVAIAQFIHNYKVYNSK